MQAKPLASIPGLAFLAALALPAMDPVPPPGGFPWNLVPDTTIAWSDGYQTRLDVYYPLEPAPPAGWPMALVMHGGLLNRKSQNVQTLARRLAAAGYVAFSYDYRGEGSTTSPLLGNPPWVFNELDLTYDAAESFAIVASLLPPNVPVDLDRLAMSGISAGGRHCYRNAAMSGRLLPANGRPAIVSPVLRAIAPRATHLDPIEDFIPRGNTIRSVTAVSIFNNLPPADPQYQAVITYDPAALATLFRAQPLKDFLPEYQTSVVPTLIINAWDDVKHTVAPISSAIPTLMPGVMRRVLFTTDGVHSVPNNRIEKSTAVDAIVRWFDYHLKGLANGVDLEPFAEAAVTPLNTARYVDPTSQWGHVVQTAWPPTTPTTSYYLNASGQLSTTPPAAAQPGPVVQHRIGAGYSITGYLTDGGVPAAVITAAKLPLSSFSFDSPPLANDVELLGQAVFAAEVDVTGSEYQLCAQLHAVPPGGSPRYLTFGTASERNLAPGLRTVAITMTDMAYIVPAGWRIRLTLQNLAVRQTPMYSEFHEMPYFTDTDMTVTIDPAQPAHVDLPVVSRVDAILTPRIAIAAGLSGINHTLSAGAGSSRAFQPYVILMGASGHGPGLPLPGAHLPLNWDAWTTFGVAVAGAGPFTQFVGLLDASGQAQVPLVLGSGTSSLLVGTRLSFAVIGLDPAGFWTGGPALLDVQP